MGTCKMTSFLSNDKEHLDLLKERFDQYPCGMTLEEFREVFSDYASVGKVRGANSVWGRQSLRLNVNNSREVTQFYGPCGTRNSLPHMDARNSISLRSDLMFGFSIATLDDAFSTLRGGRNVSLNSAGRSIRRPLEEAVRKNDLEVLFNKIDSDSDGIITWDDVLQLAVEEATQSITVMTEEMRSYSLSRTSPQMKLVQSVHTLPSHKSLFAVVTRADPLILLTKKDFNVVKLFSSKELENAHPQRVEYLPLPDVFLACTSTNKTIRGWWNVISTSRMGTLSPLILTDVVRQMRTQHNILPYSFFTGGSHGSVTHWQVPKQRFMTEMTCVSCYEGIHSRDSGGITDFALTDEWLLSTGFDHRVLSTNLETGKSLLIGRPRETLRFVEYNPSYLCLPSVSYTNQLLLWDVRSSAVTPATTFGDDSVRQHRADIIGLCNAPGLPQVITGDSTGLVKVWDLRVLRCMQTVYADGSVGDDQSVDFFYSNEVACQDTESFAIQSGQKDDLRRIHSIGYFGATQEIVCASSTSIYCVRYNYRRDGGTADVEPINYACYDLQQGTVLLQGPTRTSVWDAADGFRKRVFNRASHTRGSYRHQEVVAMCIDGSRSRVFFALADGTIELRSSKTFMVLETIELRDVNIQEMLYSARHNMLVIITANGTLSVFYDTPYDLSSSVVNLVLSNEELRGLTLSDDVGLIGCCDNSNLFFVDFKQSNLYAVAVAVERTIRTMCISGKYPIMVVGSDYGEISLWSTPPVEESYVRLASVFVGQQTNMEKAGCSSTLSSASSRRFLLTPNNSIQTIAKVSGEGTPNGSTSPCVPVEDKKKSLADLVQVIAEDDSRMDGIAWLACDDVSHRLFAADQKGNLFVYSLCPFIQGFGFQHSCFEKRMRYRLRGIQTDYTVLSHLPLLLNTVSLHTGPINYLTWIPALSALISCACDRVVKVLDHDGKVTGQFFMDRLPPKRVVEDVGYFDNVGDPQKRAEDQTTPYALPSAILSSTMCQNCAGLGGDEESDARRRVSEVNSVDDCTPSIALPTIHAHRGVDVLSCRTNGAIETQLVNFISPCGEDSTTSPMKNTAGTVFRPSSISTTATTHGGSNASVSVGTDHSICVDAPPSITATTIVPVTTTATSTSASSVPSPSASTVASALPSPSRLVALEEKKQWKPLKEKPRAFRERECDPQPRWVSPGIELFTEAGVGVGPRPRPSGVEDVIHRSKWWEPSTLPIPPPVWRKRNDNFTPPMSVNKGIEAGQTTPCEGLLLFGSRLSLPGGKLSTCMQDTPGIPATVSESQPRNTTRIRGGIKKNEIKRRLVCAVKSSEETDKPTKSNPEAFLDDMLRSYERELHRCIRGKKGKKRHQKNVSAVENA